jgi:hypothetical protein
MAETSTKKKKKENIFTIYNFLTIKSAIRFE